MNRGCGIGRIAIDEHVHVRIDVAEDRLHNETFPATRFVNDLGAGGTSAFGSRVRRVVVEDADQRVGKFITKIPHHAGNRDFLVVAGNEDGDFGVTVLERHWRDHSDRSENRKRASRRFCERRKPGMVTPLWRNKFWRGRSAWFSAWRTNAASRGRSRKRGRPRARN